LRSYFAAFGYEFYYHDCHLGTDGYTNMHDLEDICLGTLEQATSSACLNAENGILFIVSVQFVLLEPSGKVTKTFSEGKLNRGWI
jgi:hypothetical protein